MNKHPKTKEPSDRDLMFNPLIGASKGVTRAAEPGGYRRKGTGTGAMAASVTGDIEEGLSNRDKSRHFDARGLLSKWVQTGREDYGVYRGAGDEACQGDR